MPTDLAFNTATSKLMLTDRRCANCIYAHFAICGAAQRLSEREILAQDLLNDIAATTTHDSRLLRSSDLVGGYICVVISGLIKLKKTLPNTKSHIVGLCLPSDLVDLKAAAKLNLIVEAASGTTYAILPQPMGEKSASMRADAYEQIHEKALEDMEIARDYGQMLRRESGRANANRVERFFAYVLARLDGSICGIGSTNRQSRAISLPLTRSEMADYLDMKTETLSRQIKVLRDNGEVIPHGHRVFRFPAGSRFLSP